MNITEERFRQGTGQKFLQDGRIRCQGLSKGQIYKWREEHDDWATPSSELWPECQCVKAAELGLYACYWHGGRTPKKINPTTLYDTLPIDLAEKFKILITDPAYISRKENIAVLRSRQWEILEKLQARSDSEETWGTVADALYELQKGHEDIAATLLKEALANIDDGKNLWDEYYKVDKILNDTTGVEVKTAKELQSMATAEQVGRLMNRIYEILTSGAEKYINDKQQQSGFLRYVAGELNRSVNLSPATIVGLLESGSGQPD